MSKEVQKVLDKAISRYGFSPRAVSSCLKVARTIADIAGEKDIAPTHMQEATEFHVLCNNITPEL